MMLVSSLCCRSCNPSLSTGWTPFLSEQGRVLGEALFLLLFLFRSAQFLFDFVNSSVLCSVVCSFSPCLVSEPLLCGEV